MAGKRGNPNLRKINSEEAREMQKISAAKRKENALQRRTIAEALKIVLAERVSKDNPMTKLDAITIKAVKKLFDDPKLSDIKILTEILGENVTNVNLTSLEDNLKIEVTKGETKSALAKILGVKK